MYGTFAPDIMVMQALNLSLTFYATLLAKRAKVGGLVGMGGGIMKK